MFKGWRARLHYHTRNKAGLKKWAMGITIGSFFACWVAVQLTPKENRPTGVDPTEQGLRNSWQKLHHATAPEPRRLARWLRHFLPHVEEVAEAASLEQPSAEAFQQTGKLAGFDIRQLLQRHAPDAVTMTLFEHFLEAALQNGFPNAASDKIKALAELQTPPPLANELYAALLLRAGQPQDALPALMREGRSFADATSVREDALRLALKLNDEPTVREIAHETDWLDAMRGGLHYEAGKHLLDPWLMGQGLIKVRLENLPLVPVILTLFATGLWYTVLVLQSTPRKGWWWFPLLPMAAGVVSIWPTLWIGAWQELRLGMSEHAPFPRDVWFWVMGVGLREEVAKLALFSLFLPWLLRRRDAGLALITGAFVGLGFALEENIDYYQRASGSVALGRFLTANFMHLAETGIAAHALYDLMRSRFNRAGRFVALFAAVVAIHGLYDYAAASSLEGGGFFTIALLAFVAWFFLDLLAHEAPAARQVLAPAGVFVVGTAVLVAACFAVSAFSEGSVEALVETAQGCLGVAPVAFIYWRRLQ
jgi:RsiW-degrading membrane proteinase PrsW (M82 family)